MWSLWAEPFFVSSDYFYMCGWMNSARRLVNSGENTAAAVLSDQFGLRLVDRCCCWILSQTPFTVFQSSWWQNEFFSYPSCIYCVSYYFSKVEFLSLHAGFLSVCMSSVLNQLLLFIVVIENPIIHSSYVVVMCHFNFLCPLPWISSLYFLCITFRNSCLLK